MKVWTRRYKGLRSVLAGYLVAFDKHMNLVSIISSSPVLTFSKLLVGNSRKGAIKMQVTDMQMVVIGYPHDRAPIMAENQSRSRILKIILSYNS